MNFLRMLAERTLGTRPVLTPRLPSRYEVPQIGLRPLAEIDVEQVTPATGAPPSAMPIAGEAAAPTSPASSNERLQGVSRAPMPGETPRIVGQEVAQGDPSAPRRRVVAARMASSPRGETTDAQHATRGRRVDPVTTDSNAAEPPPRRLLPLRPTESRIGPAPDQRPAMAARQDGDVIAEEPTVRIHIGRIEVRAAVESKPPPAVPARAPSRLDAYLKARNGERR